MKKAKIKAIFGVLSIAVLLCTVLVPKSREIANETEPAATVSTYTAKTQGIDVQQGKKERTMTSISHQEVVLDEEALQNRFISMLNRNNAFNDALKSGECVAKCAAVTLSDYAQDKVGYGLCVSAYLVKGFVESFYGIALNDQHLVDQEAPSGYISLPQMEIDKNIHSLVSCDKTSEGYEVLTCMKSYSGGGEYATCLVKSTFIENSNSEFGFNLVYCETL